MYRPRHLTLSAILLLSSTVLGQPISSFETEDESKVLRPSGGTKTTRVQEHATHEQYALKCVFPGNERDTWPGLAFEPQEVDLTKYHILGIDVYNPSDGPVALSWRIDGANGQNMFTGQSIPPKKTHTAQLFIKDLTTNLGTSQIKRFFPYIRMPRRDVTLYFDNLRFMTLDLRFTPMIYEETAAPAPPTAEERRRGYALFARHWLDVVFPNSRPRPGERGVDLKTFATPGEYEPVTFSVHALRDLAKATVTVSALRGPQTEIPPTEITVYPVCCLNKRVTYSSDSYVRDLPVLLERRREVDIAKGQSRRFWIDVHVPTATPPGIYRGTATLKSSNAPEGRVPLTVRVLPFELHEPRDMIWGEYYTGPKLAKDEAEKREFLDRDLRDMREHGATSVGLCIGAPTDRAKMTARGVELDFDGSSLWEHFMNRYRDLGFPAPVVQLSDSGQGFASSLKLTLGSDEYAAAYKGLWMAIQELCKEKGWPEIIVQPVDEPGWQGRDAKDRNVTLLKLLKQIPGLRTEQDGPGDSYFHKEAGPYADVWNYNGGIGAPEVVASAQKQGHLVMLYNCDVESYRPEIGRYVPGFFQKRAGISGCYNWSYMSWRGSPYDDLDHTTGTWMHVYPPFKDEVGGPSTGWQGFREGVDDYKYIATLEQTVTKARASGRPEAVRAAAKAEGTLKHVLSSIAYSPRVRSRARWTSVRVETHEGAVRKFISGTLKLPNGWSFDTYDLARWQVADATLEIMAALGEVDAISQPPLRAPKPASFVSNVTWTDAPSSKPTRHHATKQIAIPPVSAAPRIDGDIGDPVWQRAVRIPAFTLHKGGKPAQQTEAWLCVDKNRLYLALKCHEDKMAYLTANVTVDGGKVWEDDCVEVFIDGNLDRSTCCQICVNSLGKQYWSDPDRPGWRAKSVAAATTGAKAWFVEIAIPLRNVGLTGNVFGLNLCRERRPMEAMELSCWCPTGGSFRQPEKFGVAKIGTQCLKYISAGQPVLGANELTAVIVNEAGRPAQFMARLHWAQKGRKPSVAECPTGMLDPGETKRLGLSYRAAADDAPIRLKFELISDERGKVLAEHKLEQSVRRALDLKLSQAFYHLSQHNAAAQLEVAASQDLRKRCALTLTLSAADSPTVLRRHLLKPVAGSRVVAQLDVSGLAVGRYTLTASLVDAQSSSGLSRCSTDVTKVRGPFD